MLVVEERAVPLPTRMRMRLGIARIGMPRMRLGLLLLGQGLRREPGARDHPGARRGAFEKCAARFIVLAHGDSLLLACASWKRFFERAHRFTACVNARSRQRGCPFPDDGARWPATGARWPASAATQERVCRPAV